MKRIFLIVAIILLISTFIFAQADAGFLEDFGTDLSNWYCLNQRGYPVAMTPYQNENDYSAAVQWCEDHDYGW